MLLPVPVLLGYGSLRNGVVASSRVADQRAGDRRGMAVCVHRGWARGGCPGCRPTLGYLVMRVVVFVCGSVAWRGEGSHINWAPPGGPGPGPLLCVINTR